MVDEQDAKCAVCGGALNASCSHGGALHGWCPDGHPFVAQDTAASPSDSEARVEAARDTMETWGSWIGVQPNNDVEGAREEYAADLESFGAIIREDERTKVLAEVEALFAAWPWTWNKHEIHRMVAALRTPEVPS